MFFKAFSEVKWNKLHVCNLHKPLHIFNLNGYWLGWTKVKKLSVTPHKAKQKLPKWWGEPCAMTKNKMRPGLFSLGGNLSSL